jgi:hypothetical protein
MTRKFGLRQHGQSEKAKAICELDTALSQLIRARDSSCITCGPGDVPLDAGHFRRRECMATRFDYRNVAGQCTEENRFKGGNLQKFSLAIGKGTQQQPLPLSNATEELGQLTSPAGVRPPFAILPDTLASWHSPSRCRCPANLRPSIMLTGYSS